MADGAESGERVTMLLKRAREGDAQAGARAVEAIYDELKRAAALQMRRERGNHTLEPAALVNEAWMRMAGAPGAEWENRGHFLAVAARLMREILVDHARRKAAAKRGGMRRQTTLDEAVAGGWEGDHLLVEELLTKLEKINGRAARVAEARLYSGMSFGEIAEEMGIAERTAKRDWKMARAWWLILLSEPK